MKNVNICKENLVYASKLSMQSISELAMECQYGTLEVESCDGYDLIVEMYMNRPTAFAEYNAYAESKGDRIDVVVKMAKLFFFFNMPKDIAVKVYVPRSYCGRILVDGTTVDTTISSITASDMKLRAVTGDMLLRNVCADTIKLTTTTGRLEGGDIAANDLRVNSTTGPVRLSHIRKNKNEGVSAIKVSSTTGKVILGVADGYDEMAIDVTTGSIELSLPCDYRYESSLSVVTGKVVEKNIGNPPMLVKADIVGRLRVNSTTGSVTIIK